MSNFFVNPFVSAPQFVSYDGDEGVDAAEAAAAAANAAAADAARAVDAANAKAAAEKKAAADKAAADSKPTDGVFTQEQLNKILADERRKNAAKLAEVEGRLETVSQTAQLTAEEKAELATARDELQKQLLTKEQMEAKARQELEANYRSKLDEANLTIEQMKTERDEDTIRRSLIEAAAGADAFQPTQMFHQLRHMTSFDSERNVVISLPDHDVNTGEPIINTFSPEDAMKRMSELPEYGNLFRPNVVKGVGGGAADSGIPGNGGKVDIRKLSPEQYQKLRKENPSAVGL